MKKGNAKSIRAILKNIAQREKIDFQSEDLEFPFVVKNILKQLQPIYNELYKQQSLV